MKQQWHPVVYFHKQVSHPTFTKFWLTSIFFFFGDTFSRNPSSSPRNVHYQNSYHTPTVMSTSNGEQDVQVQATGFLKGCVSAES